MQSFYENLDPKFKTDNRKFWKQVKPFFSDKTPFTNNITLLEGDEIATDNSAFAEILNNYVSNSMKNLEIDFYVNNIDSSQSYQKNNIPPNVMKGNAVTYTSVLGDDTNRNIDKGKFPVNLKNADITPLFKKLKRILKRNYKPGSMRKYFINKCMNILI